MSLDRPAGGATIPADYFEETQLGRTYDTTLGPAGELWCVCSQLTTDVAGPSEFIFDESVNAIGWQLILTTAPVPITAGTDSVDVRKVNNTLRYVRCTAILPLGSAARLCATFVVIV